jgi:hypothetical protein
MTLAELYEANAVNVKLICSTEANPNPNGVLEQYYGMNQISDEILSGYTFVGLDDNGMATYTV